MSIKIRTATIKDSDDIANIHALSWQIGYDGILSDEYLHGTVSEERRNTWRKSLTYPKSNQCIFVAESENEIIGFICALYAEHSEWGSYIDNLHIDRSYQSKGVARLLLERAVQWCNKESPETGMCLLVSQYNERAQKFYTRLGGRKKASGSWVAPDGTEVPTFWFIWQSYGIVK